MAARYVNAPGPRRLDRHQAQRVQERTLERYRLAARPFTEWLFSVALFPSSAEDWDDALVEYKNEADLSQSVFAQLVSAVELFFPRHKGKLAWSHSVLSGMAVAHVPRHTVPCSRHHSWFMGAHLCSRGRFRIGFGMPLQQVLGLRPSELLNLFPDHVMFSDETGSSGKLSAVLRLGARRGTKAKREQFSMLLASQEPILFMLLRRLRDATPAGCHLFPYSLDTYRRLIKDIEAALGLRVGWGPHSPRAGFATDAIANGVPFADVQEKGRWLSPTSLRTYVDVVTAFSVNLQVETAQLKRAVEGVQAHFPAYFPEGCFSWEGAHSNAPEGQPQRSRRALSHHSKAAARGISAKAASPGRPRRVTFAPGA